jgi:hypothetical protein
MEAAKPLQVSLEADFFKKYNIKQLTRKLIEKHLQLPTYDPEWHEDEKS